MDGHDSEIAAAAATTSSPNDGYGSTEGRTAPGRCALDHGGPGPSLRWSQCACAPKLHQSNPTGERWGCS